MILTTHIVLLTIFVTVTTLLMVTAVVNRIRIQQVRLMWHSHSLLKELGWFSLFFLIMIGFLLYAGFAESTQYLYLALGYLTGGVCWVVAIRLSSATLITDFAIVRNTVGKGNALGWNQVTDFFIREDGDVINYIFFYREMNGTQSRFELNVPRVYQHLFKKVVYRCVEKKTLPLRQRAYG